MKPLSNTKDNLESPCRHFQLVIFDLDGTLIDAYQAIAASFNYTMRKFNLPARSLEAVKKAVGWGDRGLLCPFVPEKKLKQALKVYQAHHKKALPDKTKILPGATAVLKYLRRRGYRLAVASNRPKIFSDIVIKKLKLKHFFDYVLCGDQLDRPKPYPDILLKIIGRFSVRKNQALYVGDMTIDVKTGKNAGIRTVALASGSSSRKELSRLKPFKLFKDVRGLLKIL